MKFSTKHVLISGALISFCAIVVIILGQGLKTDPNKSANALQGLPAKAFSVDIIQTAESLDFTGRKDINLDDFKGKPLVLNFWASWCVSCRAEAHQIEKFWKQYGPRGIQVVGIAIQDSPEAANGFIRQFGKTYTIGLDTDGKAGINYGVTGVPETFFIDPKGVIRHKESGPVNMKILQEKLSLIM